MPARRIIVVGAGLAGLTVADELTQRGFDVVVLEARDRVGGRCHTVDGVDMGAHWIHGTEGNPITALARRFGLPTMFVGGDSTFTGGWDALEVRTREANVRGDDAKLASILAADAMWDELEVLRREQLASGAADISVAAGLALLRERGALPHDAAADWHLELLAREDAGCGAARLSLRSWDEGVEVYGYGDSVLAAGYTALANALAARVDVRLGRPVHRIEAHGDGGVSVSTGDDVFTGDAVVVTVPLGVLQARTIEFVPPLPDATSAAIDRVGVGDLAKVVLRFERAWWQDDQYAIGVDLIPLEQWPTIVINLAASHLEPVLVVLAGGELGRWLESATMTQVESWSTWLLSEVFGDVASLPIEITRTAWSIDPFSRGSYSAMHVGSSPEDLAILARPVGPVHFAGEATSETAWSTAHGAVLSGRREAARIAADPTITADRFISETRRWRRQQQRVMRFHHAVSARLADGELAERLALMRTMDAFDEVPPRDLEALASMFDVRVLATGERLCSIGDEASDVYVIADGSITPFVEDGIARSPMGRGEVLGELAFFVRHARTADLVANRPSRVLVLDYDRFRRFLLAFPEACLALVSASVRRLVSAERSHTADTPPMP